MKASKADFAAQFLSEARHSLDKHHLTRIDRCLAMLSDEEIWWRPNAASNSVGNLVLHLCGNVRQWIISGLGGAPEHRERDKEFTERGPLPRPALQAMLRKTVREACRILARLRACDLARSYVIQKFNVTGFVAVSHVTEHFAFHAGQIIFVTKMKRGEDLGFTRLPGEKRKPRNLPAI